MIVGVLALVNTFRKVILDVKKYRVNESAVLRQNVIELDDVVRPGCFGFNFSKESVCSLGRVTGCGVFSSRGLGSLVSASHKTSSSSLLSYLHHGTDAAVRLHKEEYGPRSQREPFALVPAWCRSGFPQAGRYDAPFLR